MPMPALMAADSAGADSAGELTREQERAVARRGEPLLVSAGAGSGKTSVLVERFVRAVCEDGVSPARILAITFTDRAAAELRERVRARLLERGEREAARDTEAAFVSTFHGFCTRLLRSHALRAGLDPQFQILEEGLATRLRERAFALALAEFIAGERAPAVDLVAAYGADRLRALLWRTYAEMRSRGHSHPRLPPAPGLVVDAEQGRHAGLDEEASRACALIDELLERFGRAYDAVKRSRGAVDFDDLELRALELLGGHPSLREAWSQRFELVMVDEFQDTNPRQLAILEALERENLFTVGDELQSIYGFRDADVRLFRARRAQLAKRDASLELTRNFRSSAPLREVINAVFEARLGERYMPLVAGREQPSGGEPAGASEPAVELLLTAKRGWNGEEDGEEPGPSARGGSGAPPWRRAEARALAERVAEIVRGGEARPGEVVVLLRALGDIGTYERALQEEGLRTLATAGGFWARQQVHDLLAYLRAVANPLDELALYGTLASPLAGLSSDGLALIARAAQARHEPPWATLQGGFEQLRARLSDSDGERLAAFRERFAHERGIAPARAVSRLIERALSLGGYEAHVRSLEDPERRMANIHKLLRLARRFEASEGRDLRGFLDHIAHQEALASGPEADAPVAGVEPDAVRLMSVHAAKGLEFTVVCIADLGRALNLGVPDLLVDGERVGLRLARLDGSEPAPALEFAELCEERKLAQAEEEERILYVAMTRARERLLLSAAVAFERWPDPRQGAPTISWLGPALAPQLSDVARSFALSGGQALVDLPSGATDARVRCRLNSAELRAANGLHARPSELEPPGAQVAREDDARQARAADGAPQLSSQEPIPSGGTGEEVRSLGEDVASLSYTALAELRRCAYRFYLERVLGLEENRAGARGQAGREGLDARARGAIVHRLLESADAGRPAAPSAAQAAAAARALGVRASRDECVQMAKLASAATADPAPAGPAARLAAAEDVRREHPFAFSLPAGGPLFTGVIDVLAREADGGFLVVDYKTDRVGAEEQLSDLVEREYALQRLIYALALLRAGAPSVEIVHWFLERPEDWVTVRYGADERVALEERLSEELRHAQEHGYVVSRHPHRALCETCPGRAGLCSWSDTDTLREAPRAGGPEPPR
jgi:ATP-dependent exoDNAse (exonuclease V) beta subunit